MVKDSFIFAKRHLVVISMFHLDTETTECNDKVILIKNKKSKNVLSYSLFKYLMPMHLI